MDYILKSIDKKIQLFEKQGKKSELRILYQARIEYVLLLIFSYLWNKNFELQDSETREKLIKQIQRPSIGTIVELSRALDLELEIYGHKKFYSAINQYPDLRNNSIGHGFVFDDGSSLDLAKFKKISDDIDNASLVFLDKKYDIILVTEENNRFFSGISLKPDGANYDAWSCLKSVNEFTLNASYLLFKHNVYFKISPFIHVESENDFFVFRNVVDRLTGKLRYNNITRTGTKDFDWPELTSLWIEEDPHRRRSQNNTIVNVFDNNFKQYIDTGTKQSIKQFITKNRASVAVTIWGHGGVGKTASVQSTVEDLLKSEKKFFDYVIFLSAKDRFFNYLTGTIEAVETSADSYDSIIKKINFLMGGEPVSDSDEIEKYQGKILIIIDDYETFSVSDRLKIELFKNRLDIDHHKVIITTRASIVVGEEIRTQELDRKATKEFLLKILQIEFSSVSQPILPSELSEEVTTRVHELTAGRPLFIFQFAFILVQEGLASALDYDLKKEKSAIEFLFGRIYHYLTDVARDVFVVMGYLVHSMGTGELSNLLEKVKYILKLEDADDVFLAGIQELVKLKIIEITDSKFFQIYSNEILEIMLSYYSGRDESFKLSTAARLDEIGNDSKLDNEQAILANANASRISKDEASVVESYKNIIDRPMSSFPMKLQAILNLGNYLFSDRGDKEKAIQLMGEYQYIFGADPSFVKMFSMYCWSTVGHRPEAIEILLKYFSRNSAIKTDANLELYGRLLTIRSSYWLEKRQETKTKARFNELGAYEQQILIEEQTQEFKDIFRTVGVNLASYVKSHDISERPNSVRTSIATGLYQFVEICVRLKRYDAATEVCEFMMEKFSDDTARQFSRKREHIFGYRGRTSNG